MNSALAKMVTIVALAVSFLFAQVPTGGEQPGGTSSTALSVVTYNVEWLGAPERAKLDISRTAQIRQAAQDIIDGGGAVYALQEIIVDPVNGDAFTDLLNELNRLDKETWAGGYNEKFSFWWNPDFTRFPAQRQAFVYKASVFSNVQFQTLLTEEVPADDARFASGRLPFMMTADVKLGDTTTQIRLVCLHLKCCKDGTNRRRASMHTLAEALHKSYRNDQVMVLGDMNVADAGGADGEMAAWGLYSDRDSNGVKDYSHAAGSVADLDWNDIDHILISDELLDEYTATPEKQRNITLKTTHSDHQPIKTTLVFAGSGGS
ncbi:hypothetical protein [Acanthopleuribacter pedis]|uniref:Endonuclease/exonuclease/phosphatase domain-containing protein n=1 Tax=Acanthopleuribacter pedis TaxID=442870 RepID=A0A8J7U5Y8_9BACT|nr:hypothetical protein [Acanthopleuribacter pedis]MBO1322217.1 hypothetical protein [Acanthopleuribacter pedis]